MGDRDVPNDENMDAQFLGVDETLDRERRDQIDAPRNEPLPMCDIKEENELGELEPEDRDGTETDLDRVRSSRTGSVYLRVKLNGETKAMLAGHSLYRVLKRTKPEVARMMELERLHRIPDRIPNICFDIIRHPFVLQPLLLVGPNLNLNEVTTILYEDVPMGTIDKHVILEETHFNDETILQFAYQLATAIAYCHLKLKIIHRDINSKTIFVFVDPESGRFFLKLGGFTFARRITTEDALSANSNSSLRFSAPETLARNCPTSAYSYSSDIWSYGMVLDFIAHGGRHPFPTLKTRSRLKEALLWSPRPTRPQLDDDLPADLVELIKACLRSERRDEDGNIGPLETLRPTASQICAYLSGKGYIY